MIFQEFQLLEHQESFNQMHFLRESLQTEEPREILFKNDFFSILKP